MASIQGMAALERRLVALRKSPRPILVTIQLETIARAQATVAVKTGFTRRSIQRGPVDANAAFVIAGGASVFLEHGTKPHRIPKFGNSKRPMPLGGSRRLSGNLRRGSSPTGFAWHVQHPGTKPQPFLIPAAEKALESNGWRDVPVKEWNDAG